MSCTESFPWTPILGIAGIIGTLLGGWLGNLYAEKRQRMSELHEDRTRFHKERIELYGKLLLASQSCRQAATAAARHFLGIPDDTTDAKQTAALEPIKASITQLSAVAKMVDLVASGDVRKAAEDLVGSAALLSVPGWKSESEFDGYNFALAEAETAFSDAARCEVLPPE
jgi:hypothetical protein